MRDCVLLLHLSIPRYGEGIPYLIITCVLDCMLAPHGPYYTHAPLRCK